MNMVSIICVYNNTQILNKFLTPSLEKQTVHPEIILIDNRNNRFTSAASALNYGAQQATGKYLIFAHQDINLTNPNWIKETVKQIEQLDNPGIIGVAGKTNDRFIRTNIKHGLDPVPVSPFGLTKPVKASTVDECIFIIPRKVFDELHFDEKTCFDWHLYGTDYLLSVRKLGYNAYIIPTELEHRSKGASMSEGYYATMKKLQKKHFNEKIIRNCMTDWYTYIPVSIQRKMKRYNKEHDDVKLNFFDTYMRRRRANRKYHEIDKETYDLVKNSGLFDEEYYTHKYNIDTKKYDPLTHFITVGYLKDYNPSANFDTLDYYDKYHDVRHVDMNPLVHYLKYGKKEGRHIMPVIKQNTIAGLKHKVLGLTSTPSMYLLLKSKFRPSLYKTYLRQYDLIKDSQLFDKNYYMGKYPSVKNFHNDLILHYMFIGYHMGYKPNSYFNIEYYREKYGLDANPLLVYLNKKQEPLKLTDSNIEDHDLIKESGLFDKAYYENKYPEYSKYNNDSIYHYLNIGYIKGYNPSENFDNNWYLEAYPNVKKSGMNPLIHYLKYGVHEKKIPKPLTEEEAEIISNTIDENARNTPLHNFDENSPLVSIIILTRDGIDYLKTLFKNFKETICYPNYEIIVVDNDSSDNSVEYLRELSKTLPLKIIENKVNESFSEANNKGVEQANGDYILLLNNDMKPIYGWLNHMMNTILKSDKIGIVGAKLIYPYRKDNPTSLTTQNEGIKYTELNGFLNKNDGYIVPYNIKENNVLTDDEEEEEIASILGAALLIKKDLYQMLGGLDDEYIYNYEDIDLCFKALEKGYKVIYSPKAKLYHYYQATRQEAFDVSPRDMKNRIYLYRKWNKWLCEKLFMDRLENNLIFSEKPLNITFISNDPENIKNDEFIDENDVETYNYTEATNKYAKGISIDEYGWELNLIKNNSSRIKVKDNTDIIVSDSFNVDPNKIQKNNRHQILIGIVNSNIENWLNTGNYKKYDIILTSKRFSYRLDDAKNKYTLYHNSLFEQIKDKIEYLHENDIDNFNEILLNYDFEEIYPHARDYLCIAESEYFDEKWYSEHYDITGKGLDPAGHYLKIGGFIGYNPSPRFSSEEYYTCNDDVKNAKVNPLLHYELYGRSENREIHCSQEDLDLYNHYKFLISDKIYPFTKMLFRTKKNQIFFYSPWTNEADGQLNENSQIVYDNLDSKYKKLKYTKKQIAIGEHLDLLHKMLESKVIIIDNGCSLLYDIKLKHNQYLINIWHACGTFKKVGYDAPIYSDKQLQLFAKEFSQYTNFIVSSENITDVYAHAHGMDEKDVLGLGMPRTDIFYDEDSRKKALEKFYEDYPNLKGKEIILYAPTFRDTYEFRTGIDWSKLSENLDSNEVIVIKRHIRTNEDLLEGKTFDNIIYIEDESIFTLMYVSKLMITDYSSVIFEYCLLNKPVVHYCPDYDEYTSIRDFYLDFSTDLYGDIVEDPDELIDIISKKDYHVDKDKIKKFFDKYMSACDGHATERVVGLIEKYMNS